MYVAFDFNSMHFDEREGDSSMIVEEVSSVVVDTAFHGELLDGIYVTMSS